MYYIIKLHIGEGITLFINRDSDQHIIAKYNNNSDPYIIHHVKDDNFVNFIKYKINNISKKDGFYCLNNLIDHRISNNEFIIDRYVGDINYGIITLILKDQELINFIEIIYGNKNILLLKFKIMGINYQFDGTGNTDNEYWTLAISINKLLQKKLKDHKFFL